MSFKVSPAPTFQRAAKALTKRYISLKAELADLTTELAVNPTIGTPIGSNCYKIRLAIKSKGKGKSGGARVITLVQIIDEEVVFLTIYDKAEKADLRPGELQESLRLLEE